MSCSGGPPPTLAHGLLETGTIVLLWVGMCIIARRRAKEELRESQPQKEGPASVSIRVEPEMFTVCLTNLPDRTSAVEICSAMAKFGEVIYVQVIYVQQAWNDAPLKNRSTRRTRWSCRLPRTSLFATHGASFLCGGSASGDARDCDEHDDGVLLIEAMLGTCSISSAGCTTRT